MINERHILFVSHWRIVSPSHFEFKREANARKDSATEEIRLNTVETTTRKSNYDGAGRSLILKSMGWCFFNHRLDIRDFTSVRRGEKGSDHLGSHRCWTMECANDHRHRLEIVDYSGLHAQYVRCGTDRRWIPTGLYTESVWTNRSFAIRAGIRTQTQTFASFEWTSWE